MTQASNLVFLGLLVVGVVAVQAGGDAVALKEPAAVPGVLRQDGVALPQHPQRSQCDVLQVACPITVLTLPAKKKEE